MGQWSTRGNLRACPGLLSEWSSGPGLAWPPILPAQPLHLPACTTPGWRGRPVGPGCSRHAAGTPPLGLSHRAVAQPGLWGCARSGGSPGQGQQQLWWTLHWTASSLNPALLAPSSLAPGGSLVRPGQGCFQHLLQSPISLMPLHTRHPRPRPRPALLRVDVGHHM